MQSKRAHWPPAYRADSQGSRLPLAAWSVRPRRRLSCQLRFGSECLDETHVTSFALESAYVGSTGVGGSCELARRFREGMMLGRIAAQHDSKLT